MTKEELEKEAEEYADRHAIIHTKDVYIEIQDAYIAGAEPREKRIAELEKKITALRQDWDVMKSTITDYEKENAELKEKLKPENCLKLLAKEGYVKFTSEQLTKAKEILKAVVNFYPTTTATILCEAEKFISEVEK